MTHGTPVRATVADDPIPSAPAPAAARVPAAASTTIVVPGIALRATVGEGVSDAVLDTGPGHWPGTAAPGGYGNVVIAAHRSTSDRSFERIGELAPGDPVVVADATGTYTYVVEGSDVVAADRLDLTAPAGAHDLLLVAEHPPGSEQFRYVVHARLVSPPRPPGI